MKVSKQLIVVVGCGFELLDFAEANVARAQCGVASAYTVLSKISTGSAFCSTLLYPRGAQTSTVTVATTSTKPCKTVTRTETESITKTVYKTKSTTLPTVTFTEYSSSVLVPSGTHRAINKRQATTASPAVMSAAGYGQCKPTPSELCDCPSKTISAACSSLVKSPTPVTSTVTITSTEKCPKSEITVTSTVKADRVTATTTMTIYPAPHIIYAPSSVTLTTTVPAACAASPYYPNGNGDAEDIISYLAYPYFPQTFVECCVLCYDAKAFPNCVASAYIDGSASCELLLKVNATAGEPTSRQCPLGIENYPFDGPHDDGNTYPGPCGY